MSNLRKIRTFAAIVLLCGLFLPLGECSRHDTSLPPPPEKKTILQRFSPQDNSESTYLYAYRAIGTSWQGGTLALVALLWPLACLALDRRIGDRRLGWILYAVEVLLCAGSLYWLYVFTALDKWLYGTYVVGVALILFGVATVVLMIGRIRVTRADAALAPSQ